MTAIHRNYDFGKDCNTTAVFFFYNKIHDFWDGSVHNPEGRTLPDANPIVRMRQHGNLLFSAGWLLMVAMIDARHPEKAAHFGW